MSADASILRMGVTSDINLGPDEGLNEPLEPQLGHDMQMAPVRGKRRRASGCSCSRTPCTTGARRSASPCSCSSWPSPWSARTWRRTRRTSSSSAPFAKPSDVAKLGGDVLGRDVLSRVLYGGRSVLILSFIATAIGMVIGVSLGLFAGYARAAVDDVIMRLLDVFLAFPQIVLVLLLVSVLGPRLWLIVLTVGLSHAPRIARVARGSTLEVKERDFVKAAESLGVSRIKIAFGEILPNITSPLLVEFGLRLTYSIGLIAALSFLGFGMQPPACDWGLMINENRIGLVIQPYSVFVPVALIAILTIGVNLATDGVARAMIGIERDTGA